MPIPDAVEKPMPIPHCPECDAELPGMAMFNWQQAAWMILCLYCPECLKTLHFQVVPIMPDPEPSRIQVPS